MDKLLQKKDEECDREKNMKSRRKLKRSKKDKS